MDDRLRESFKKFHHENKRNRIENDGCATWNEILTDLPFFDGKQPRISVVFTRYQGHTTNATVVKTILETGMEIGKEQVVGYVLAIPSYWLEVDVYLALNFVETYIDNFIADNFSTSGGSGSGSGGGCPVCPEHCPNNPPPPPPPPMPPRPPFPPPPNPMPSPFLEKVQNPEVPVDPNIQDFNKP